MQDLVTSYRQSIKNTKSELEARKQLFEYKTIDKCDTKEVKQEKMKIAKIFAAEKNLEKYDNMHALALSEDITILRSMLSSMRLALSMMNNDIKIKRSMGKLPKENREISFDPHWISRREDAKVNVHEIDEDTKQTEEESQMQKERLVRSMTSSLTKRQKEILELVSTGYTHEQIADLLNVQKSTISNTIARAKEKISQEGWFMP